MKTIIPVARQATVRPAMPVAALPARNSAPRAVLGMPRADVSDPGQVLAELQRTTAAFQQSVNDRIANLERGRGDVLDDERENRINTAVGELQASVDQINRALAARSINGQQGDPAANTPQRVTYARAFDAFFRTGEGEGQLNALAIQASLTRGTDSEGGYVAPPEFDMAISRVLANVSAMRRLATVRSISAGAYRKPVSVGGAASGWVEESDSRSETTAPQLRLLDFPAKELYANPAATQQLLDDAGVDIAAWLADEVSIEFGEEEGAAFISGAGVASPRGILSYDTVAAASWAWGKVGFVVTGEAADFAPTSATVSPADVFIDALYALKPGYRANASWLTNRKTAARMRKFKDNDGAFIWQPSAQLGQPATFLGYPVEDDDNMPDVAANAFSVAVGDFKRAYLIADRTGVRVLRDPYTNKPFVHFYTTKRVGGGIQNFEALKLIKHST